MLDDNTEEGMGSYEDENAALGEEDADLITRARAAMSNTPYSKASFHTPPAVNEPVGQAGMLGSRLMAWLSPIGPYVLLVNPIGLEQSWPRNPLIGGSTWSEVYHESILLAVLGT